MTVDLFGASLPRIALQGRYRYTLRRSLSMSPRQCAWIMLNPSTADDTRDDPTIRRCKTFSQRWGYGKLIVVNLFALRATDPKALRKDDDPVGPDNDRTIEAAVLESEAVICAWGSHAYAAHRVVDVLDILKGTGTPSPMCIGVTKDGSPRHPLYVKADAPLIPYERRTVA